MASSTPPYPEMIMSALEALKEPNGSNKTTISKYIESKYGDLPADHSQLLSLHLNKMKDSGELVFSKNNYATHVPKSPPKRGRGRPPKPKDPSAPVAAASPKLPRGRPPKDRNSSPGSGRPRGRPRKIAKPGGGLGGSTGADGASPRKPRGRPPKVKMTPLSEVSVEN